jgi:hypothetical protein
MEILASDIRAWAQEQGLPVGIRGRLSIDLIVQYLAAHPKEAKAFGRTLSGVEIPARGRMKDETRRAIATVIR